MKLISKMKCLLTLTLCQLCNRNTGPAGNDLGDLLLGNSLLYHGISSLLCFFLGFLKLTLQLRKSAVLDLGCLCIITGRLRLLHLIAQLVALLLDLTYLINLCLLTLPLCLLMLELLLQLSKLLLKSLQTFLRQMICFLFKCLLLNTKLHDLTVELIQFCRHAVKLCLDHCARLIHQIDRLIRQETV